MAKLVKEYMLFYLFGREAEALDDDDIDVDDLADKMMEGTPVHEVCAKVAESVAAPLEHDRTKKEWIAENRADIDEAGGDANEAYRHYVQGRKDQFAYELEEDVVQAAFEEDPDEDDDDEEDEDDDDDDESDD